MESPLHTNLISYHGGNSYNQDRGVSLKKWLIIADGNGANGVGGGIDYGSLAADIATSYVTEKLKALTGIPSKEFFIKLFKDANEDYPIMLRLQDDQRKNMDVLSNMKVTYRDMAKMGMIRQVPMSAFADINYTTTYGGIKRKNQKRKALYARLEILASVNL